MIVGVDDVAITGVGGRGLNGITDDPGASTIWCVLAGVTPWLRAGVDTGANVGVLGRLVAGKFTKTTGV